MDETHAWCTQGRPILSKCLQEQNIIPKASIVTMRVREN